MKLLIAVLLCGLVSLALSAAVPEATAVEPKNDRVDIFREEIFYRFGRLQSFYDRLNAEMRRLRLDHVELVTTTFNNMMQLFGEELDFIRRASVELDAAIESRREELGNNNECLQGIIGERDQISQTVNTAVQGCARRANTTMQGLLRDVFYPSFAMAQETASTVPLMVMDALSRGNVLGDEEEILTFLAHQYDFITQQWPSGILQVLTWETRRFQVEGDFYVDEMLDCLASPVFVFIQQAARLNYESYFC